MKTSFRNRGFTLIELMIVIAILAVLAAMAVPGLLSAKLAGNHANAVAFLRDLSTAQAQFATVLAVDSDRDGLGEYGTFAELSGALPLFRNNAAAGPLDPPVLPPTYMTVDAAGRANHAGYLFIIYLPDVNALPLPEVAGGGPDPALAADVAEFAWSAYAWPIDPGTTGNRAYYVDQRGEILTTEMENVVYSRAVTPAGNAALTGPSMTALPAIGIQGTDTNVWKPVQ